jgi:hypothetical protein
MAKKYPEDKERKGLEPDKTPGSAEGERDNHFERHSAPGRTPGSAEGERQETPPSEKGSLYQGEHKGEAP